MNLQRQLGNAIAHKILVSAYHVLAKNVPYHDLGEACLDQIGQTRTVANLKRRLEGLGYKVTLEPNAQPTAGLRPAVIFIAVTQLADRREK